MYKLFIDDSGQKEYFHEYNKNFIENIPDDRDFLMKNFFCLAGVYISKIDLTFLNTQIQCIKKKYFQTNNVEIKSTWLRDPNKRQDKYLIPYRLTSGQLNNFGNEIIDFISMNRDKIKILGAIFDKRYYRYRERNEAIPLLKTTQVIFEKVEYMGNPCEIVFDQMEKTLNITLGTNHHKILLVKENHGMENVFIDEYTNITDIQFQKSCNDNFLQLADLCAYNIYRQFVDHYVDWEKGDIKMYEYFEKIVGNIHSVNGRIIGKGLVIIPNVNIGNPI